MTLIICRSLTVDSNYDQYVEAAKAFKAELDAAGIQIKDDFCLAQYSEKKTITMWSSGFLVQSLYVLKYLTQLTYNMSLAIILSFYPNLAEI